MNNPEVNQKFCFLRLLLQKGSTLTLTLALNPNPNPNLNPKTRHFLCG